MNLPVLAYWRLLSTYLAAQRGRVLLLALLLFGGIGVQLASPQLLRVFIDGAQAGVAAQALVGASPVGPLLCSTPLLQERLVSAQACSRRHSRHQCLRVPSWSSW